MRARLSLLVMLAGSLAFLASLYLTWISATPTAATRGPRPGLNGLLDLLSVGGPGLWDGWGTFGQAAALAAVALIVLVLVSVRRPELSEALPVGGCAIALAALALANAADLRTQGILHSAATGLSTHLGTGAYVGGAAAFAALLGAAAASRNKLAEIGSATTAAAATLLTAGLVASDVVHTLNVHAHPLGRASGYQFIYFGSYGVAVMLLVASFGLTFWLGAGTPLRRLSTATVVLILAVGHFSILGVHTHWPYEAWLAIGCAAGLLALAVATDGLPRVAWPARQDALALGGAFLLFASFFFKWERSFPCSPPPGGTCFASNGWGGGLTGGLVAILVVLLVGFRRLSPELAIAVGIYVIATGLAITAYGTLSYGAFLGFAGAALLLLAVAMQSGTLSPPGFRVVPILASLAFAAIPALALTGRVVELSIWRPWFLSLFQAAAIVVGLRLCGRWLAGRTGDAELLLLPIALLALTGLNLGEIQHVFVVHWESLLALALCVFLIVCGLVDRNGGVPEEIWRIDRISTAEDVS